MGEGHKIFKDKTPNESVSIEEIYVIYTTLSGTWSQPNIKSNFTSSFLVRGLYNLL